MWSGGIPAGRARAAAAAPGPTTAARAREVGAVGGSDPPQRRHNPVGDPGGKAVSAARAGRGRQRWRWAGAHGARAPLALFVCAYEGAWRGGSNLSEGRLCRARKSCSSAIPTMPTQGWETWNQRLEIINQVKNKTSSKLRSILSTSNYEEHCLHKITKEIPSTSCRRWRNFGRDEPKSLHPSCSCKDSE